MASSHLHLWKELFPVVVNQMPMMKVASDMEAVRMFVESLHGIFMSLFDLAVLVIGAIYTGLVLANYRTNGPHYRPHINAYAPVRSAESLLIWLGVKTLALTIRVGVPVFGMLSEASAEVGEWYLCHRDPETLAAFRSRFMV
jgi:hypothetical protein